MSKRQMVSLCDVRQVSCGYLMGWEFAAIDTPTGILRYFLILIDGNRTS